MANSLCFVLCVFLCLIFSLLVSSELLKPAEISSEFLTFAKRTELFDWMVRIRRRIHENP